MLKPCPRHVATSDGRVYDGLKLTYLETAEGWRVVRGKNSGDSSWGRWDLISGTRGEKGCTRISIVIESYLYNEGWIF